MNVLLGDFNEKMRREDSIFKLTIGNESLRENSDDNESRVVGLKFSHQKMLSSRVQCSHITKFINTLGLLLIKSTIHLPRLDR
jgi:hypothetical protein